MQRRLVVQAAAVLLAAWGIATGTASAQTATRFPDRPIRLVVGVPDPVSSTPQQFGSPMGSEIARWRDVVEASGARVD